MLHRVLSVVYLAVIALSAPLFYVWLVLVWAVTRPFDRRRVLLHQCSCLWGTFPIALNPLWHLTVTGRERIPWRGGAVLVANHASLIDILVLFGLFRPFKWVSKKENFDIPFIGWGMRLNDYVELVRGDRASVVRMLARCGELLRGGSAIMMFPEGTRSPDGQLKAFKDGAFELAVEHGVPLVPIAVHGTGRALAKGSLTLAEHVNARVEVLEPLDPADFPSVAALRDEAHRRIGAALEQSGAAA